MAAFDGKAGGGSKKTAHGLSIGTHWGAARASFAADGGLRLDPLAEDPSPSPLMRGYAELADHPLRIGCPAVREGWLTARRGGRPDERRRGAEPFIPVPWDQAIALAADEIERVGRSFGNESIFAGSYGWGSAGRFHHPQSQLKRFMTLAGGFTFAKNTYSHAAGSVLLSRILGGDFSDPASCTPDWASVAAAGAFILAFGGITPRNTQVEGGGFVRHHVPGGLRRCAESGCRLVVVSPTADDAPDFPGVECLSIRPGTDTAFMLGVAHALIEAKRADEAFLARCTVGYEQVAAYVIGREDGVAKTPEWAAAICDCPAERIREVAGRLVVGPSLVACAWSLQRAEFGEQAFWMAITLAALVGQIGQPGCGLAFGLGSMNAVGRHGVRLRGPALPQGDNPVKTFIPVARIADLLLNPGATIDYDGQRLTFPHIRLVYWAGGNPFHHHQDLNRLRQAWKRPETVIVNETHWNPIARHADIVFPVCVGLERGDVCVARRGSEIFYSHQILPPRGEARTDHEVFRLMAARLGFEDAFTEGRSADDWLRWIYEGFVRNHPELPPFERFREMSAVDLADLVDDPGPVVPMGTFVADPEGAPLGTPSGKIELFSRTIASFGYADCGGHAGWFAPAEWLGSPATARHPLHLLSPQPENRLHSQLDQTSVGAAGKVAGREPVLINPRDAAARGIAEGQVVRVFNDRGACLAGARLTAAVRPGVVVMATGAWYDPDDPDAPMPIDRHGNPNVLTADVGTSSLGQGPSVNCLVDIAVAADPPPPGWDKPPSFSRP
ncbi:molybdopterin-dependent oxidoreductase [Shumkonia mesophila]|uniref:molybdopterin-dependent oxidoreductase n=1 Tax=Shumkonia mesophila TaxID=2838854 RepID=UPI002934A640|nr:molybdopterin-dependent oxidoreductase [Shumkonia mesophila]